MNSDIKTSEKYCMVKRKHFKTNIFIGYRQEPVRGGVSPRRRGSPRIVLRSFFNSLNVRLLPELKHLMVKVKGFIISVNIKLSSIIKSSLY